MIKFGFDDCVFFFLWDFFFIVKIYVCFLLIGYGQECCFDVQIFYYGRIDGDLFYGF